MTKRGRLCYNSPAGKNGEVVHFLQRRRAMVTYADMFTYSLVLIGLASLIFTVTRHKK